MLCKDCMHFKQWKKIEACVCIKTKEVVEANYRLCDNFISKSGMTDEWGESTTNNGINCCD